VKPVVYQGVGERHEEYFQEGERMSSEETDRVAEVKYWRTATELPPEVFEVLRKPDRAIDPVTIVATVDVDGMPRTAPFGSVRAVNPRLLRMISMRYHDTFANLCRDGRVAVAVVAPPNIAVCIRGKARVARERMKMDENDAILEIEVEEVKNDMVRSGSIESCISFAPWDDVEQWFDAALAELEEM
jgi:hypothetical protein